MKRIITILLTILTVTAVFASCSRRDRFRPDETDAPTGEQTTVAGQPDGSNPGESTPTDTNQSGGDVTDPGSTTPDIPIGDPSTGDAENGKITGNPYEGWTAEELYASFMEDRERSIYNNINEKFGNTPYYVILDVRNGGSMFSKLTGQVVQICKDPICDHENCIFSMLQLLSCLVVDDRCYLLMSGFKGDVYQESSNYLGGDFYLCSADGESTRLFRLATDGVPDQVTQFLLLDGHYVLFTYQTYKDFQNSYNPGVPEWERSIRFCFVDLYTGQAYDMGVDLEEIN